MWTSKRVPFDASAAALWLEGRVGPVEARQRFADEARAIGVELEERYAEIAARRLCQDVLNFEEVM